MMELKVTPGTPGAARVEYYACRADVEAILALGHTARAVYEHMKDQGRVTCSYSAFCDYVRGGGKRKHSTGRRKRQAQFRTPAPQQTGPRIAQQELKRFVYPGEVDPQKALLKEKEKIMHDMQILPNNDATHARYCKYITLPPTKNAMQHKSTRMGNKRHSFNIWAITRNVWGRQDRGSTCTSPALRG